MAKYNRDQARMYARWYANNVCHDGAVACVRSSKTVFEVYKPLEDLKNKDIDGENDCTHFVSCCIGHHGGVFAGKGGGQAGGGLPIPADFPAKAYGILGVPRMVKHLTEKGFAKFIGKEKMPRSDVPALIPQLQLGDLIAYAHGAAGGYAHLVIHLYSGNIACHTSCRLDLPWSDVGISHISLLHITY